MSQAYPLMFSAGRIGRLIPKNRLVLPPMVRNYADDDGHATGRYITHIDRIARGGVGTIILEASFVRQDGKGFLNQLGIHHVSVIPRLRTLVDAGHHHGALMGIQLFHGGRQASAKISGEQPVAPSAITDPVVNELPRALSVAEIGEIVLAFGKAAHRAYVAGVDFVELHGAHGYLIAEFLSPFSNYRNDNYGGTPENRRRFLEEVYASVRASTAPDFPIIVQLSGEETLPGGLTLDETVATAKRLEQLGVAALHISTGSYATYAQGTMIPPMAVEDGVLRPLAERVKTAVTIPVIAVGKLRTPAMVEEVLQKGQADFVALGRSLLADPDWPNKVAAGQPAEVRHCIACNQGCISRLFDQKSVWCTVNPEVSHEMSFVNLRGGDGRKLLVIGGGPAGMTAARYGAIAGFKVTLHESRAVLGGQLPAAAAAPHRQDWAMLRDYLARELERLGVEVRLNSTMSADDIARQKPWVVIVATGAEPVRPEIPGWEGMCVATGRDILEQSTAPQDRIVIAGGGCAGAQTAEYLVARGSDVTLLEAEGDIAVDAPIDERTLLLSRLQHGGVKLMPNTRLVNLAVGNVVTLAPHETRMLPADMVVLCLGSRPVNAVAKGLGDSGIRHYVVGDAVRPRKVTDAIAEGAFAILDLVGTKLDTEERALIYPSRRAVNKNATSEEHEVTHA
ncbi:MAG: FAD-dependent oxidoreductase [Gammaproteobacteria bacterium]|nr:FAD-dependent oxidoreductase [Gammaproteobacteria bacterium]